jgi:adenosylhomocysteine nucleosidase
MIAIFAALKDEIKFILQEIDVEEKICLRPSIIFRGEYLGKNILVAHTGIGYSKMKRTVEFCIKEYQPELCLNIGYCGALTPGLSLGQLVIADSVIYENTGTAIPTDSNTFSKKIDETCKDTQVKFQKGIILTVDKVVSGPHEKAFLGTKFGAIALDMESAGLANAASASKTPFAIIRAVLDPMDMHLPSFTDDDSTNSINMAIKNIINKPQNILALPQLHYCASEARQTLTRFINELIKN